MRNIYKIRQMALIKAMNVSKVVQRGDQTKINGQRLAKLQKNG